MIMLKATGSLTGNNLRKVNKSVQNVYNAGSKL